MIGEKLQMKFYSDITKEMYESVDELNEAEAEFLMATLEEECDDCTDCDECEGCTECDETIENVPTRKELAANVDKADAALKQAKADYDIAKQQVEELSKSYLEAVDAVMEPAKKAVSDAEKAKYKAIKEFNDSYGAYQVTYTGARAAEEMLKTLRELDRAGSLFDTLFTDNWMKHWLF